MQLTACLVQVVTLMLARITQEKNCRRVSSHKESAKIQILENKQKKCITFERLIK